MDQWPIFRTLLLVEVAAIMRLLRYALDPVPGLTGCLVQFATWAAPVMALIILIASVLSQANEAQGRL